MPYQAEDKVGLDRVEEAMRNTLDNLHAQLVGFVLALEHERTLTPLLQKLPHFEEKTYERMFSLANRIDELRMLHTRIRGVYEERGWMTLAELKEATSNRLDWDNLFADPPRATLWERLDTTEE